MSPWTLLLIGAVQQTAGFTLEGAKADVPVYHLIHSQGYPDSGCNPDYLAAAHLGHFGTVNECALAAIKEGVQVFTYEPTGRHKESCVEVKIPVNTTVWSMWRDSTARKAAHVCPGGKWIPNENTYVYAWMPPAPATTKPPAQARSTTKPLAPARSTTKPPAPARSTTKPPAPARSTTKPPASAMVRSTTKPRAPPPSPLRKKSGSAVKAFGDPHLVNIKGQRFDILRPGVHSLLQIPQGSGPASVLLQVTADVKQIGGACGDMYFQAINVTGHWAHDGHQFLAKEPQRRKEGTWQRFGPFGLTGQLGLKVAWGHTGDMFPYLNMYVKNLNRVGYAVGGLLGEDDHTYAATPGVHCKKSLSLLNSDRDPREEHGTLVSFATVM